MTPVGGRPGTVGVRGLGGSVPIGGCTPPGIVGMIPVGGRPGTVGVSVPGGSVPIGG